MSPHLRRCILPLLGVWAQACMDFQLFAKDETQNEPARESDTDADSDTDTDADSDADTDADSDADTGPAPEPAATLIGAFHAPRADLTLSADGTRLYATRVFDHELLVVDTATMTELTTVAVGGQPAAVRVTPDDQHAVVAVNNSPGQTVVVDVDPPGATYHTALHTITLSAAGSLGVGVHPGSDLVVALSQRPDPGLIQLVDLPTATITDTLTPSVSGTAPILYDAVFTPDGSKGYAPVFQSTGNSNVLTSVGVAFDIGGGGGSVPGLCVRSDHTMVLPVGDSSRPIMGFDTQTLTYTLARHEVDDHADCIVSPLDDFVYVSTGSGDILRVDLLNLVPIE